MHGSDGQNQFSVLLRTDCGRVALESKGYPDLKHTAMKELLASILLLTCLFWVTRSTAESSPQTGETGFQSYSKFAFVPGDQIIYFEDFSQDNVGDFPAKWGTTGSGEVVTLSTAPGKRISELTRPGWNRTARGKASRFRPIAHPGEKRITEE